MTLHTSLGNQEPKPLPDDISQAFFRAIVKDDHETLTKLSKAHDPNLAFLGGESLLNIAKNLGKQNCYQILVDNGADKEYAKKLELTKQFGHTIEMGGKVEVTVKLKSGATAKVNVNPELASSMAGLNWVKSKFEKFSKNNNNFAAISDSLAFSVEHADKLTKSDPTVFYDRIAKANDITCIPSGYPGHNIGVMFYKDKMIVCDGSDKIAIHSISSIDKSKIKALMNPASQDAFNAAVNNLSTGTPIFLPSTQQTVNNCTYVNFVGAVQGILFLKNKEKGMTDEAAKLQAQTERQQFDSFSTAAMVKEVATIMESGDKKLGLNILAEYIKTFRNETKKVLTDEALDRINKLIFQVPLEERIQFCKELGIKILDPVPPKVDPPKTDPVPLFSTHAYTPGQPKPSLPIVSTPQMSLNDIKAQLESMKQNNKLADYGIRDFKEVKPDNGLPSYLKLDMFCTADRTDNGAKTEVRIENKLGSQGATFSMPSNLSEADKLLTIDQLVKFAVETAPPGAVFNIPSSDPATKQAVQEALDRHLKEKYKESYKPGENTVPGSPKEKQALH